MLSLAIMFVSEACAYPLLQLDSQQSVVSDSEWTYFEVDCSAKEGFFRLSLFTDNSNFVFALSSQAPPVFTTSKHDVTAEFVDYDSWSQGSSKHFIVLSTNDLPDTHLILGIGQLFSQSANVTVKAELSAEPLCPNDCSSHGRCKATTCDCDEQYIGYDCGIEAVLLPDSSWTSIENIRDLPEYAYVQLGDRLNLVLTYKWSGPDSIIAMGWHQPHKVEVPTLTEFYIQRFLSNGEGEKTCQIELSQLHGDILYMAIYNLVQESELQLFIKIESDYELDYANWLFYIIACSVAILLSFIFLKLISRCRNADSNQNRIADSNGLSYIFVDQSFPKLQVSELEELDEVRCTICLEEFKPEHIVRKLKCSHLFHAECIETWFNSNTVCCLCKRDCSVIDESEELIGNANKQENRNEQGHSLGDIQVENIE